MKILRHHLNFFSTVAIVGTILVPLLALAGKEAEPENVKKLAEKLQESRKGVIEAEAQKRKILGSLYVINQRMKKITSDKSHLTNELFQVQDNVKVIAKAIASLEKQIDKQRVHLRRRLRTLYKLSGQGYISAIFSRQSASDLDETLRFLKIVTDGDYRMIKSYQENIAMYKAQKTRLRGQIEKLVAIEGSIKKQESLLATEHQAKSKIVSELDREKVENINRIKTLRDKSKEFAGADQGLNLADLLKPSIYEQKGQLIAPLQGTIVQDFGLIIDERYKIRLSHKGWRYAAPAGTPVAAIFEGRIAHSDHVEGYGHTVVIDHGDHYYTVYASLAKPRVKVGDLVKKAQIFAEAGSSGHGNPEGLYFEIRHFSEPENPNNWIAKNQFKQASIAQGPAIDN